jgi:hypothetical protein
LNIGCRAADGSQRYPHRVKDILKTQQRQAAVNRFEYSIQIGAVYLIPGEK